MGGRGQRWWVAEGGRIRGGKKRGSRWDVRWWFGFGFGFGFGLGGSYRGWGDKRWSSCFGGGSGRLCFRGS